MDTDYNWDITNNFYNKYSIKSERENVLKNMTNEEIDILIKAMPNLYGKIYLSSFKKQ